MNAKRSLPGSLPSRDGHLLVNGRPLGEVVEAMGGTPAYVYDRALIDARVRDLRDAMPAAMKLHYAIKANPMSELVCHLAGRVDGVDVASRREMLTALSAGVPPRSISFAGPGKTDAELRAAAAAGVVVSVESQNELRRLERCGEALGRAVPAIVRLNPEFALKRSGLAMTGYASQFGVDVQQVSDTLQAVRRECVDVLGFQVYAGSQNLDAAALVECQRETLKVAAELASGLPGGLRYLNLGGGFGIPYFESDAPLDLGLVGRGMHALAADFSDVFASAEVVLELGRYLVGEAGYYVASVVDVKESRGERFAVVDGGMHHHLANSGNLGQVVRRNFPVFVGNRIGEACTWTATVTGPLCTPLDIVGDALELPPLEVGDLIVVAQSGAYGLTASPQAFLSHPAPAEILV